MPASHILYYDYPGYLDRATSRTMKPYVFGDTSYIVLDGDLDLERHDEIAAALPFVDSWLVGHLVQFRRKFVARGGDPANLIVLLPQSGDVRRASTWAARCGEPIAMESMQRRFRSLFRRIHC